MELYQLNTKQISWLISALAAAFTFYSPMSFGHLYMADVDEAQWNVDISPLYCRLWQPIPAYGMGLFENRAGERQFFILESEKQVYKSAQAQLAIVAPEWKFNESTQAAGTTDVVTGYRPVKAEEPLPSRFLDALEAGFFPDVKHPGWFDGHTVEVQLSSVNFTAAYQEYLQCLSGLYPANFEQLERTTVLFDSDKYELKPSYFERLKLIKGYLEIDPEVLRVVIDGHTDNTGRDGYNYELSRNRAEVVAAYLKKIGIPESKLLIRYHGEQYPIAKNKTPSERRKNRRTTLRLDKGDELE
ncbi:MAG TPA: OmpA family protein [Gammaproteobacteria bacterium]|nr:hypothetical protein [Gammaproteobacteria bacterium]HBF07604.1 OmpA family protein [Gammaproteobacteria bacterium]HCK92665.1 OmpA family protein [Gammaproteobacteria bacterium]|tara:strand:+ start:178 stop:1077 length:900 start_codon:yes stop_codon:yes gene_type:complete